MVIALFAVSLVIAFFSVPVLNTRLKRAGISGEDIHKPGRPPVSEMGGLAIVMGFGAAVLLAVAMVSFFHVFPLVDLITLLAVLSTVLLAGLIGMVGDLLGMQQWGKAFLPSDCRVTACSSARVPDEDPVYRCGQLLDLLSLSHDPGWSYGHDECNEHAR